jgi:hypothetical protein
VKSVGQVEDEFDIVRCELAFLSPFGFDFVEFGFSGESAGHEEPPHGFWERFESVFGFLGSFLEIRNGVAFESDALHWVEGATVVEKDWEASHTEDGIIDMDLTNDVVSVLLSQFGEVLIRRGVRYFLSGMRCSLRRFLRVEEKNLFPVMALINKSRKFY